MNMFEKKDYLIVVDMQNDFITGSLGSAEAQAIVPAVVDFVKTFDKDNMFFTRDTHYENYMETQEGKNLPVKHCINGTEGWKVIPQLTSEFNPLYIDKETFGFSNWGKIFLDDSSEINSITLCGVCTDICVISNALILKALFPEVIIRVKEDCCAGVNVERHTAAIETMKSCQIEII